MSNLILSDSQSKKRIVFTVGVFDFFHLGHLRFLEKAKKYGDVLIVAVQKNIKKYKPNAETIYSLEQRIEFLKSIRYVDEVVVYNDVDKIIKKVDFDVFIKGEDQLHSGFVKSIKYCEQSSKQVICLPRTKNISSTKLRELIKNISL